jgi:regulator of extracellular matrix RemA (YlzA/DUF370 family)
MPNHIALNVGFYNFILKDKIIALINSDSAPMRRMIQECRKDGRLIDATQGRKTKSVIFLVGGNVATSALPQDILLGRMVGEPVGDESFTDTEETEESSTESYDNNQ